MSQTTTRKASNQKALNYKASVQAILKTLRRDRDRQILAKRFGLDLTRRQTLEKIGRDFGITRERVRQIEKAALAKIQSHNLPEVDAANRLLVKHLEKHGHIALSETIAQELGAATPGQQAYIIFLGVLAGDIEVIGEDDHFRSALAILPGLSLDKVRGLNAQIIEAVNEIAKPTRLTTIQSHLDAAIAPETLASLASISKGLAHFEHNWGLASWPEVNPKSIRDKTYLIMGKHGQPMHFREISEHIKKSDFKRRDVTVQAVHNELIKDSRFILIGRGIYALAEWGYTPGTVADIIIEVLREESPLHKDEIINRVLQKRQVKTTTIILNLQEKAHFERVAKATYKLKDQS